MAILTSEELQRAREFVAERDKHANLLGQLCIAFDRQKQFHAQQIELLNHREQVFMAGIAVAHGIDVKDTYTLDYMTGELKVKT